MKRIALVVVALLTSACASIPSVGPVVEGQAIDVRRNNGFVRVIARPPQSDISPEALVKGFLSASASIPEGDNTAFQYLTAAAASQWNPNALAHVYDAGSLQVDIERAGEVRISAPLEAIIDEHHRYIAVAPGTTTTDTFSLRKVAGQWRIDSVPKALYLAMGDVERSFRAYPVYFLDGDATHVVPQYVMLPVGAIGLPRMLLRALYAGPSKGHRAALRSAIPSGTPLRIDSVSLQDAVAIVRLDRWVLGTTDAERRALAAQLTWTLTSLPTVALVRLTVDGQVLDVPGVVGDNALEDWQSFNAARSAEALPLAYVDLEGARILRGGNDTSLTTRLRVSAAAVSRDGQTWAVIEQDRRVVTVGTAMSVQAIARGGEFSAVEILPDNSVWFLDREGKGGLHLWDVGGGLREVATELPKTARIIDFAVAADRVRIALAVNDGTATSLRIGAIARTTSGVRIVGLERVEQRLTSVDLVAWGGEEEIIALGGVGAAGGQLVSVTLARGGVTLLGGPPNVVALTAAPDEGIVVGDQGGQLWTYYGGMWSASGAGFAPNYAL